MASPLSNRTNAQPLSLELLKEHVPVVKKGQEAIALLKDENVERTRIETNKLLGIKRAGSRSQEVLILSALPLIKNIASREFQRRKAWSSRVSYDDLLQEAIAGFIRGLLSYNELANHNSPTNYLGQWITTSIRRKIEALEHDFAIPYEVVERARRIRAVFSRLSNENSESPTDVELLEALNEVGGSARNGYRWGGNKNGVRKDELVEEPLPLVQNPASAEKKFTQAHLEEARALNAKSYALVTHDAPSQEAEESYERASTPLTLEETDGADRFESNDLAKSRNKFFEDAFMAMKIGSRQKDIILRFFGMAPYDNPQTQKEIITETTLPPRFIKSVITSFQIYMPLKGGVFHKLIVDIELDEIEALELAWLLPRLGEWQNGNKKPISPPLVLTQSTLKTTSKSLHIEN